MRKDGYMSKDGFERFMILENPPLWYWKGIWDVSGELVGREKGGGGLY